MSRPDVIKKQIDREILPPPPPPIKKNPPDSREKQGPTVARVEEEDIFVGDGTEYVVPTKDMSQSPISEDMDESPRNKVRTSYFDGPAYGPVPPSEPAYGPVPPSGPAYGPIPPSEPAYGPVPPSEPHDWQTMVSYLALQVNFFLVSGKMNINDTR